MFGDEVDRAVGVFESSPDEEGGCSGDCAEALPAAPGDEDVGESGLVLDVEEGGAAGGHGALPVGDDPGDADPRTVGVPGQRGGGRDSEGIEAVSQVIGGVPVGRDPGGPEIRDGRLDGLHAGQRWRVHAGGGAGQLTGSLLGGGAGGPESFAAVVAEAVEGAGGGERFEVAGGEAGDAPGEVVDTGEGSVAVTLGDDRLGGVIANGSDGIESECRVSRFLAVRLVED